ncbi:MAG: thiamine-phosphate kinase [Polyangiaceae bacterium]|jgi:thiamine-monophosphate kinase
MDEAGRIELLRNLLDAKAPGLDEGIGDDAAVLSTGAEGDKLVWTIDEQVDQVHFRRDLVSWKDLGWRSFMAAASDVAAMGAVPWCALSAMVLPNDVDDVALGLIGQGQRDAGRALLAPIVGGNLARGRALTLATSVLGKCQRPVRRRGARPGDQVWLAGSVGLARAGLEALLRGVSDEDRLGAAVAVWRRPRALVAEGLAMARVAHAAIDVSDGLACDAGHMAAASGVEIVLDEAALLADPALGIAAEAVAADALDLALFGGEDYALVVAAEVEIPGFRRVGAVRPGAGVVLSGRAGERPIDPKGFDHFREDDGVTGRRQEV